MNNNEEVAVISTKFGDIVVEFYDEVAPKHVESFKLHIENGYFDNSIFHRVIPGFVIQGGDPNSKSEDRSMHGMGGHAAKYFGVGNEADSTSWMLPAEFNDSLHTRGILSMARAQDPNSGGSQFFVCVADVPQLDHQYTVFGKVIKGMEFVDMIVNSPRDARDNPHDRVEMTAKMSTKGEMLD
ncbi:MAG: peptidylprolyl isomerase [Candidatus Marinimicrobia bacterium]|nr:peptidylprolyl isomerase [Candidatus Neomarinimicrobiota bacterium]